MASARCMSAHSCVRALLACRYSTAGIVRALRNWLGQSLGPWPGNWSSSPARVASSNAAAASACSIDSMPPYGASGSVTLRTLCAAPPSQSRNALSSARDGKPFRSRTPTRTDFRSTSSSARKNTLRAAGSRPSAPRIASNTSAASTALRAIGPTLSIVHDSGIAPWRLTAPNVGRRPATPHCRHGETIEPSVSVPSANGTSPAATALAEPADEPLLPFSGSYGLRVRPPCHRSPMASAPSDSLATSTAPASCSFCSGVAVTSQTWSRHGAPPNVVGAPGQPNRSLAP